MTITMMWSMPPPFVMGGWWSPQRIERAKYSGIVANMLDCNITESEFKLQTHYYNHFWINTLGKGMNLLILPSYGLNSTLTVLLQRWLWDWITHKGWYAIKQRNQSNLMLEVIICLMAYQPLWVIQSQRNFMLEVIICIILLGWVKSFAIFW